MPPVTTYSPPAVPRSYSFVGASAGGPATGLAIAANAGRTYSYVQNIGSGGPLFVVLGQGLASAQSFSMILKPASTDFGGDGGIWASPFYQGPISISGSTRAIAWDA